MKDFRPIALANIRARVLSNILNSRFQEYHEVLIQPQQRGFMQARQIDENLMEFYNILDLTIRFPHPTLQLLMLDLNTAFDRIDHTYIQKLLNKLEIGLYLQRLIMSTISQLKGTVRLNNFDSPLFPLTLAYSRDYPSVPFCLIFA